MENRYNHQVVEQEMQKKWLQEGTYTHENNHGPVYSIDTPPPTVSGSLHIGHIFSYTQTDIIARYKRMNGFSVFYPFGFDDNGLATERFIEKKREIKAYEMARSEFIAICLEESKKTEREFIELWQRMGLSANWSYSYSTISPEVRRISQASFILLYKKGFIYRKEEPALYCTTCRTSVAQAELDDKDVATFFNNIIFKISGEDDIVVGTTRPELLPSCVAILFNPDEERFQRFKGKNAIVPLFNFEVPILSDPLVDPSKGTGIVMVCTFGDKTDIEWYKKFNFSYKQSIGLGGHFTALGGFLEGLTVHQSRKKIIEELLNQGFLQSQKEITHAVNIHERCKSEIEYVVLPQWFLKILDYKDQFIKLADEIRWNPSFMKSRYTNWVTNLGWDWCLSRQRYYGIPFPVWYCGDCSAVLLPELKDLPVDPQETNYSFEQCSECKSTQVIPDTDVMDTWNTSSLTPYICKMIFKKSDKLPFEDQDKKEPFIPMSMRPQAHDIIRTWAFYTIVKSWMHDETIPWEDIVISGHVLSDQKEKLSKSKDGGKLSPQTILDQFPADAVRYWTSSASLGQDVAFSENQLRIGQRLITKLWNAFRFIGTHIEDFDPHNNAIQEFDTVNEWVLDKISRHFEKYQAALEKYEFSHALILVDQFFWGDFCDNYLEMVKHKLFNIADYDSEDVRATKWTLYQVGLRILQLYAPYLPHITEALYISFYQRHEKIVSIHQTKFLKVQHQYVYDDSASTGSKIVYIISQVRKLKSEQKLSLKTPLATLTIFSTNVALLEDVKKQDQVLRAVTQAIEIIYKESEHDEVVLEEKEGLWHAKIAISENS